MTASQLPSRAEPGQTLHIPAGALVVTVGAAGSGKTTFLRHFPAEAVVSPDRVRYELLGDTANHRREPRVWGTVLRRLDQRLAQGQVTVLDATSATSEARRRVLKLARARAAPTVLLVFATPLDVCLRRNRQRVDPLRSEPVPEEVVKRQHAQVERFLAREGPAVADQVIVLTPETVDQVQVRLGSSLVGASR